MISAMTALILDSSISYKKITFRFLEIIHSTSDWSIIVPGYVHRAPGPHYVLLRLVAGHSAVGWLKALLTVTFDEFTMVSWVQ